MRDNQVKLESTVDIEDSATIFERQAPTQGSFLKIEAANAGGALVGMEGRRHQHANGTILGYQIHIALGKQTEQIQVSRCRLASGANALMTVQPNGDAFQLVKARR